MSLPSDPNDDHPLTFVAMLNTRHSWSQEGTCRFNEVSHPLPPSAPPDNQSTTNASHQTLSSNDSKGGLSVSSSTHQRISIRSSVQMFDDFTEKPSIKSSTSSAFGSSLGLGGVTRAKSIYDDRKRERAQLKLENELISSGASFGPIFNESSLGTKISMV